MLEQLRKKLAAVLKRMEELSKSVVDGEKIRSFTDAENVEFNECKENVKLIREHIFRIEEMEADQALVNKLDRSTASVPRVDVIRNERHDESGNYRGFRSLGEQLVAVADATDPAVRKVDPRLAEVRAASGLNESADSQGGFLVQSDFMLDLQKDTYDSGFVAGLCRRIPIMGDSILLPQVDETSRVDGSRCGGVVGYWRNEAATVTASKASYKAIRITPDDLMALCYVTDQLLQDAPALEAYVRQDFVEEMSFKLDDAIINGDGVGKPLGILQAPCLIAQAKESAQTADTIKWENVSKMRQRMFAGGLSRAIWLSNSDCMSQFESMYVPLGSASGLPVYSPAGQYGAEGDMLYGRQLKFIEQCATLGDQGDVILGDFSKYYLVEKGTIDAQNSIHVRFLYGENTFRFTMRVGGQPRRSSAVTPFKGSVTKSDFVTLATR